MHSVLNILLLNSWPLMSIYGVSNQNDNGHFSAINVCLSKHHENSAQKRSRSSIFVHFAVLNSILASQTYPRRVSKVHSSYSNTVLSRVETIFYVLKYSFAACRNYILRTRMQFCRESKLYSTYSNAVLSRVETIFYVLECCFLSSHGSMWHTPMHVFFTTILYFSINTYLFHF